MRASSTTKPRRARRLVVAVLVLAALLIGAGVLWLGRLARPVSRLLSDRLGAEVRVLRVEVLGVGRFLLEGVRVRKIRQAPWIDEIAVERVEVLGSWDDLRQGRFDGLELRRPSVELSVDCQRPFDWAAAASSPAEGAPSPDISPAPIRLVDGEVRIRLADQETRVPIAGTFEMAPGGLRGRLRAESAELELLPLLALFVPKIAAGCHASQAPALRAEKIRVPLRVFSLTSRRCWAATRRCTFTAWLIIDATMVKNLEERS